MWLTIAAALAHPVGERFATQTTILEVHRDRLQVDYVAEVPHALLRSGAPRDGDPIQAMAVELQSGLLLQVDGAVLPMTRRGEPVPAAPTSEHTWTFTLQLEAPLPAGARELSVSTGNLQGAANYFAGDVRLYDGLQLTDCSLLQVEDGRVVRDDTLRWRHDEAARVLSATLAPPPPAWWQALAPTEPRHAGAARVDPNALTPTQWVGIVVALAATLVGLAAVRLHVK